MPIFTWLAVQVEVVRISLVLDNYVYVHKELHESSNPVTSSLEQSCQSTNGYGCGLSQSGVFTLEANPG